MTNVFWAEQDDVGSETFYGRARLREVRGSSRMGRCKLVVAEEEEEEEGGEETNELSSADV
jgi:hypothetical protein